jgi:hypothetical protein
VMQNGTRHRWRVVGGVHHRGCFHHRSPPPLSSGQSGHERLASLAKIGTPKLRQLG